MTDNNNILFKDKYRIESTRLKNWDYSHNGYYFVTICTKNREPLFGEIIDNEIKLSEIGKIIYEEWYNTEKFRKNIKLDEFVIMPNHIHGIIQIENGETKNNLSNIIRGFKSASTKTICLKGLSDFQWQPRFYEHIIKDEKSLNNIRKYINENPLNWDKDSYNSI